MIALLGSRRIMLASSYRLVWSRAIFQDIAQSLTGGFGSQVYICCFLSIPRNRGRKSRRCSHQIVGFPKLDGDVVGELFRCYLLVVAAAWDRGMVGS